MFGGDKYVNIIIWYSKFSDQLDQRTEPKESFDHLKITPLASNRPCHGLIAFYSFEINIIIDLSSVWDGHVS